MSVWVLLLMLSAEAVAQIRWSGVAGNGSWVDPINWESGLVPSPTDDVVLDNSLIPGSYTIQLPDYAVSIRSLQIIADAGNSITVFLPPSNILTSSSGSIDPRAFTTTGNGYTLLIGSGGNFINASNSSSGYSIRINDSIRIDNGGRYVHRTRTGHADIVQQISRATGTERGIFRFENTDAASTISLSNRVYGTLQLSAAAAPNDTTSYSSSGTNPLRIRGNLEIEPGVSFAINFSDTISVAGDLHIDHAGFNMATSTRSCVLALKGNWRQQNAIIFESNLSGSTGTILLNGVDPQLIQAGGTIKDSIRLAFMNNNSIFINALPALPFEVHLINGIIQIDASAQLILERTGYFRSDSLNLGSYIDGSILKRSLEAQDFRFPTGSNGQQRWIIIKAGNGDFRVRYFRADPYTISSLMGDGLDHISQVEYWEVSGGSGSTASVELSFDEVYSGGVSDLESLRVAGSDGGNWFSLGNTATSGQAFLSGSVTSEVFDKGTVQFLTLASFLPGMNTLPIKINRQWMEQINSKWICRWETGISTDNSWFEVELSHDGNVFQSVGTIPSYKDQNNYQLYLPMEWESGYCRIKSIDNNGQFSYGKTMQFGTVYANNQVVTLSYNPSLNCLQFNSRGQQSLTLEFFNISGQPVLREWIKLPGGNYKHHLTRKLPAGIYITRVISNGTVLLVNQLFLQ